MPYAGDQRGGHRPRYPMHRAYAALDLGTNNCRMLIARPDDGGFFIVDAFSRIVRLGEGLSANGCLSDGAMNRTIAALTVCAAKLSRRHVHLSRAVATEACRQASNGAEFVERVARETGILLDIIDPEEEARLAVMGCYRMLEPGDGPALIFDIGGGSTELAIVETGDGDPKTLSWLSIPWGVVSLAESMPEHGVTLAERMTHYAAMKARVSDDMASFARDSVGKSNALRLLGTSGTVTTLGSVYLGLDHYDRSKVDGLVVPVADMRRISLSIVEQPIEGRAQIACIGEERADLVVAGCAILDAILDIWPSERVGVADRGIREGILRQLVKLDQRP
jgi:exopolyphosphatase / guanosine-5'-triphosphate,3'-diphosphate pyrophosphatase